MTATTTEATKTPVTMADGRVVEFGKRNKVVKTTTIDEKKGSISVQLDFLNGETRIFSMPADLILKFAGHGAEQKLGDLLAGEASIEDGIMAVDDGIKRLEAGEWNARREKGAFSGASILFKALVEATGKTPEQVKTYLETKSAAEKTALRRSDRLKPIIDRLEAEKASNNKNAVDTESLFGELDAI